MNVFNNAKWIWLNVNQAKDQYAEFNGKFSLLDKENVKLKIACDSIYSVYLNGKLVAFSGCADFPHYKFYDLIDISTKCKKENELKILVWYLGNDSQTYINDKAGLICEVVAKDKVLFFTDENTLSRKIEQYQNGLCKDITLQLGYTFKYDNTKKDLEFTKSRNVDKTYDFNLRQIKQLKLASRKPFDIIKKEKSVIIDLKRETAGFFEMEIKSAGKQNLVIAYGEHLKDGNVRRIIEKRDFSFEYVAKRGVNKYINTFRRIAGRYLQIYFHKDITIKYVGIRSTDYPLQEKKYLFTNDLYEKIYNISVDTLKLCMHEHYEDCPWREQALYTMDSRNQMLFGYYAFKGTEFQRHSLLTIAKSLRKDGMLCICAPSGLDLPIPFFSLAYFLQVYEYLTKTKDYSLLKDCEPVLDAIYNAFTNLIDKTGLIPQFPKPFWNFYEWADYGEETRMGDNELGYDLVLNCMFVYVVKLYAKIKNIKIDLSFMKKAIKKTFYNKEKKLYISSTINGGYTMLANSFALLIGLGDKNLADKIISDDSLVKITLSMKAFLYDALLKTDKNYGNYIIADIEKTYKKMIDEGATSFWETELGSEDFDGAGSLCHGWSALPVYYFKKLNIMKKR